MNVGKYIYYLFSIGELILGTSNWVTAMSLFLPHSSSKSAIIQFRKSKVLLRVRGAMDLWIAKETFLDRFYERYGTVVQDGWVVVDIGAGIGDFSISVAKGRPSTRVYAFEPFPESFALLQENLQLNQIINVQAFPQAICGESGTLYLDLSKGEPVQFSTTKVAEPERTLPVPCLSLGDAFALLGIDYCDLLKLDCEGAEYDILFNAPHSVLHKVRHIIMEYHEGITPYGAQDLIIYLSERGFDVHTYPNPVHRHLGFLYAFVPSGPAGRRQNAKGGAL
ncbi:MAG: FkbM family methyltransferase [Anaerolineae bacterium]